MLLAGGSAADAIIATALCVGSIDSFHSGIGGGGHILVRSGKGEVTHIDMRETMPAAGYVDIFVDHGANSSILGGLAVGVPGEIRGWEKLHEKYGKLPWKELFKPAITINREGFKLPNQLATAIAESKAYVCDGSYFAER
jgi:gamma-glutamyltranspeptidase/glutathione hydrolase